MKDGKKYILVADDDREIREIVSLLLSSEGYAVATAEDGAQAAQLASGDIALYILDVKMPWQSGLLAKIRELDQMGYDAIVMAQVSMRALLPALTDVKTPLLCSFYSGYGAVADELNKIAEAK